MWILESDHTKGTIQGDFKKFWEFYTFYSIENIEEITLRSNIYVGAPQLFGIVISIPSRIDASLRGSILLFQYASWASIHWDNIRWILLYRKSPIWFAWTCSRINQNREINYIWTILNLNYSLNSKEFKIS